MQREARILFICNAAQNRSRTAHELYAGVAGVKTDYAGLYSDVRPVTAALLARSDLVVVFEEEQLRELQRRHPRQVFETRIVVLDVPDEHDYGAPGLAQLIKAAMSEQWDLIEEIRAEGMGQ